MNFSSSSSKADMLLSNGCAADQFQAFCSTIYMGTTMICDPLALLSRTQADMVKESLSDVGFSSCLCNLLPKEPCALWTILILLLTQAATRRSAHLKDIRCSDQLSTINEQVYNTSFGQVEERVERLLEHWAQNYSCQPDVVVVLYLNNEENLQNSSETKLMLKYTRRFRTKHNVTRAPGDREEGDTWFDQLSNTVKALTNALKEKKKKFANEIHQPKEMMSMPLWATILLISCIVIVPVTVLIERLFARSRNLRPKHKRYVVASTGFLSNWRAGFAAGMLARNFHLTKERRRSDGRTLNPLAVTPRPSMLCTQNL